HHSLQLLVSSGNSLLGKNLCPKLVRLETQQHPVPAFSWTGHGLLFYIVDIFICNPHINLRKWVTVYFFPQGNISFFLSDVKIISTCSEKNTSLFFGIMVSITSHEFT